MIRFYDKETHLEINSLGKSFGIVRVGESKKIILDVKNDSKAILLDIKFSSDNSEIKILKAPIELKAGEEKDLVVEWIPILKKEIGLRCKLNYTADELWGDKI